MNTTRRHLATLLLGTTALAACSSIGTPTVTPASIITEADNIASGLSGALTQLVAADPGLIPAATQTMLQADLTKAEGAAASLTANLPATTGATTVQTINGYLNAVLNALATPPINGLIPAPFNLAVSAAALLMPDLEAFVDQYLPGGTAAASVGIYRARAVLVMGAPPMSKADALALLAKYAGK